MRPGQSCPGVDAPSCALSRPRRCFNEAGAIMPRSGNEHESGGGFRILASMRPGQSCPGVVDDPVVVRLKKDGLQ